MNGIWRNGRRKVFEEVQRRSIRVDILVNNAGTDVLP
jgi:short-subunit dehydrogenase